MLLSMKSWIIILSIFWVAVVFGAICTGVYLAPSDEFSGYLKQINWVGYPIFWILSLALLYSSWGQFSLAWQDMFLHGRVHINDKCAIPEDDRMSSYESFQEEVDRWRIYICVAAVIASLAIMFFDTENLRNIYHLNDPVNSKTIAFQLHNSAEIEYAENTRELAVLKLSDNRVSYSKEAQGQIHIEAYVVKHICSQINDENKKLEFFTKYKGSHYFASLTCKAIPPDVYMYPAKLEWKIPEDPIALDRDWTEGWIWSGSNQVDKATNGWLVFIAYIQQFIIIAVAIATLLNMLFHAFLFKNFESKRVCKKNRWSLKLDATSNLHEFGLERWNQALNTTYWYMVPALIIPIISQVSQPAGTVDAGQMIAKAAIPLLLILPMVFTIIFRQQRVMDLWESMRENKNKDELEEYHQQSLWPFDRNWASKLGIILAFAMLSYLLGTEASNLSVFFS